MFAGVREVRGDGAGEIYVARPVDGDVPPPLPYTGVNDHGVVIASRACRGCGYDVRGLTMADACPECRWPVLRSVSDVMLVNSPSDHVRRLRVGVTTVIAAQLGGIAAGLGGFIVGAALTRGNMGDSELMGTVASTLVSIVNLIGWWIFSTPDPALAADEQRTNSRRVLRSLAIASFVAFLATLVVRLLYYGGVIPGGNQMTITLGSTQIPIGSGVDLAMGGLGLLSLLLSMVVTSVAMAYTSNVCARIPDATLLRDTKRMVWLVWVLVFVPCFGGLISFVLVLIYLFQLRSRLTNVLAHQQVLGEVAT